MGNVLAMVELAQRYDYEWTSRPDHKHKAIEWYRKAAVRGHSESAYLLGMKYLNGDGVEQDKPKAAKWLKQAADQGHSRAERQLEDLKQYLRPPRAAPDRKNSKTVIRSLSAEP
jgi:TPR repeat protein